MMWTLMITYFTLIGGPINDGYLFKSYEECLIEQDTIEVVFIEEYGMVENIDYTISCEPNGLF